MSLVDVAFHHFAHIVYKTVGVDTRSGAAAAMLFRALTHASPLGSSKPCPLKWQELAGGRSGPLTRHEFFNNKGDRE